jgi:3-oxoacyl-[acyl-carrier protein] reductase
MTQLAGKAAVVTGGSRGIGRAVVERLVRDGAEVVFSYRQQQEAARQVEKSCEGLAHAVQADIGNLGDIQRLFDEAEGQLGGLDILVNNAASGKATTIADATEEIYDWTMGVNAKGTFFAIQQAARRMRDGGRIVNLSSVNTVLPVARTAIYAASKAAVEQFTAIAARELAGRQITVNTVLPGFTDTDMLRANPPEMVELGVAITPLGRVGVPADIADVVAFLAGPDGRWLTGQHLRAAGGLI